VVDEVRQASYEAFRERRRLAERAAARFAEQVRELGYQVQVDVAAAGFRFDLGITTPDGRVVLADFKPADARTWRFRQRESEPVAYMIRSETRAQVMYVLVPTDPADKRRPELPSPLVWSDAALERFEGLLATASRARRLDVVAGASEVFIAMPFSSVHGATRYNNVYRYGMLKAAKAVGIGTFRVDYQGDWADIVQEIKSHIESSLFVVADLSETRPNVLYEVGYAHACGRKTILISSEAGARHPFDVAHDKIHTYDINDVAALDRYLRRAFRELLRKYGRIPPDRRRRENRATASSGIRRTAGGA
jgi:hypothetical protein